MNYVKEVTGYKPPMPELVYCKNCSNIMSFRVVEDIFTYYNWNEEDKMYHKHVDGAYTSRYYECLKCHNKMSDTEARIHAMNRELYLE